MTALPEHLTVTELSHRSGVAPSALRYYESLGLIEASRTRGNQRRYRRGTLRRVAVIKVARTMGVSLGAVQAAFATLPAGREPTPDDWERLSSRWRDDLSERIRTLEQLRDQLSSCIGCGCLSLDRCALFNQGDAAAAKGPGARYLLGDVPDVD
jgi:MerR family redox-sensitive transcriptional activator SoxR